MQASILIADDSICITEKLNATSTASGSGINWQWNLGDGTTINNNVTISNYQYANANSYLLQLIVWDTLGCRDTTTEIIFVDALGYANFTIDDSLLCIGEPLIIRDSISAKAVSFQYNYTPDLFVLNNVHNPIHSFDIITTSLLPVILTVDFEQCPDIVVAKNIKISPFPAVDLGADTNICPGVTAAITLSNKANASGAKLWSTGETVPMINVTEPNTYWLTVTDNDCSASDTANINRDCYINIPNSFTPNNDGLNDYFMPMDLLSSGATAYTMNIFNRWGEIVFSTASLTSNGWDGKFGGKPQPIGTYVYQIDVVFKNTSRKNFHGNVTLLR
jgi:gliding motility-associated-like protein